MTGSWTCPFCGQQRKSDREHVWAQWMHEVPGAQWLLAEDHGERVPNMAQFVIADDKGILEYESVRLGHWAIRLPNVQVRVCKVCNNGWMSDLEDKAKEIVGSFILEGSPAHLSIEAQELLAAWACKSFMAYALTRPYLMNPFSTDDYRFIARTSRVPAGVKLHLAHVDSVSSQVGLSLHTWAMYPGGFDVTTDPENCAVGMMAAGGLVFLISKLPCDLAATAGDLVSKEMVSEGLLDLTSPETDAHIGHSPQGEEFMDLILSWLELPRHIAVPVTEGLSLDDVAWLETIPPSAQEALVGHPAPSFDPEAAGAKEQETIALADQALEVGRPETAELLLTRAGRLHFGNGDFAGAKRLLIRAVGIDGGGLERDAEAAYRIGQCCWNLQDPDGALWYQRAIDLGLTSIEPRFGLVDSFEHGGYYRKALETLKEIEPESPEQEMIVAVASAAFEHIVEERGIEKQLTPVQPPMDLASLNESQLSERIADGYSTASSVWALYTPSDPTPACLLACAWFGRQPFQWMAGAALLEEIGATNLLEPYLSYGLKRVPGLFLMAVELLDLLDMAGARVPEARKVLKSLIDAEMGRASP